MSAAKIWAMENEPRNLTIGTLIRVAHGLGSRVEELENRKWKFEIGRRLRSRRGADEMSREKSKAAAEWKVENRKLKLEEGGAARNRWLTITTAPTPTHLHEYQNTRVTKFAFRK